MTTCLPSHTGIESLQTTRAAWPRANRLGYSVRRYFVDEFHFRHAPNLPANSRVLDLGGNRIRKRGRFDIEQCDLRVVYVNLSTAKQPDVQADAARVPFRGECFDVVICSELLEHVQDPRAVLREVFRVLRTGGRLLITVPFLYRIHGDPHDFGRYTDHFWSCTLSEIGFHEIVIERQGLFFSVLVDLCMQYVNRMWHRPLRSIAYWPLTLFHRWTLRHEQALRVQSHPFLRSFTTGFGIVAMKRRR